MIIQKIVKRGVNHKNFCEDYASVSETSQYIVAAVFDGCSDGIDSHFASALMGKILSNTTQDQRFIMDATDSVIDIKSVARQFMSKFITNLSVTFALLRLSKRELLSTMLLLVVDKRTSEAYVMAFGDGFIKINGQVVELKNERFAGGENPDADNMPDYIIYDIEKFSDDDYLRFWISENKYQFYVDKLEDIVIGSDGIFTFKQQVPGVEAKLDPIAYLTEDLWLADNKSVLSRKCNILKSTCGFDHEDDLSIIRIINR